MERELAETLGERHSATRIVRLNLAQVEWALDPDAGDPARTPAGVGNNDAEPPVDPALALALKGLRACAAVGGQGPGHAPVGPHDEKELDAQLAREPLERQIEAARKLVSKGRYRDALQIAESAHRLAEQDGAVSDRMRASESLALIRLQLGDSAGALEAARAAEVYAREANAVESRITMARLLAQVGDLEAASSALEELAPLAHSTSVAGELEEARGDLQIRLGSPGLAAAHLERALAAHRAIFGAQHLSTAAVLQLRGDAARLAGDFPAAQSAYDETLEIRSQQLPGDHPDIARTRNAIGVLRADFGDWVGADRAFAQALADLRAKLGEEHPETLTIHANRLLVAWGAAKTAKTADRYEATVVKLGAVLGHEHPTVTAAERNLARMWIELGDLERAQALLERVLDRQLQSLGEGNATLAPTYLARADLLARSNRLAEAWADVVKATALMRAVYRDEHPSVARARLAAARIALARGDASRAWLEASEAARIVAQHVRRSFGAMSDRQRAAAAQDTTRVVSALLSVPGVEARKLYLALLPHRDSVLRSISAQRRGTRERDPATRALLDKLAARRGRYAAAALAANPELAGRVQELAAEIDSLQARLALVDTHQREPEPLDVLLAACTQLPKDAALVEFVAYDRQPSGPGESQRASYAAIVVRGNGCRVTRVDLGPAQPIDQASERFSQRMRDQVVDSPAERAELGRLLLAPLEQALADTTRWLVVPDAAVWGLPLGALPDPGAPHRYLLERVTLGYLTSLYELAAPRDLALAAIPRRALLFGAPDFGKGSEHGGPMVLTASGPCRIPAFEPLPSTLVELDELGALMDEARTVTGADATKARLKQELTHAPEIVHLATHAYFAGQGECERVAATAPEWERGGPIAANPLLLSGIVLAGANGESRLDASASAERSSGILTAFEAADLDLHGARLVVLSACDTGTGLHQRGQEVQGLRWGFRAAGAGALLTSLWRSNDFATRTLMRRFYVALAAQKLPDDVFRAAEALRRAQLHNVEQEQRLGLKKPLVWANFVISGVL